MNHEEGVGPPSWSGSIAFRAVGAVLALLFLCAIWWVNQNQTYRQEIAGGYLWSPKRNANGARNPFYESMREVSPGDLIYSFVDTWIAAIGLAKSYCWECPKPTEFGSVGLNWENIGWRVNVSFSQLLN